MQQTNRFRSPVLFLLLVLAGCGGGSTGPDDGGSPNDTYYMRAKIDGASWNGSAGSASSGVTLVLPGLYVLSGVNLSGGAFHTVSISLYNIGGTGTYPLGVGPTVPGGSAIVSDVSGGWATVQSGADGVISITTLTGSRIAGTFSVTVSALTGSASGTKTVTEGEFDLEVKTTGAVGPLPANAGSKASASINGSSWNASTVAGTLTSNIFSLASLNNAWSVSISLSEVMEPGTYPISSASPVRSIGSSAIANPSADVWSTLGAGSSGSVTITSITSARIVGTFSGVLGPAPGFPATGTVTIANGAFDIGRP